VKLDTIQKNGNKKKKKIIASMNITINKLTPNVAYKSFVID